MEKYKTYPNVDPKKTDAPRFRKLWAKHKKRKQEGIGHTSQELIKNIAHDYCIAKQTSN